MVDDPLKVLVGFCLFFYLLAAGVISALSSAKWGIITTLLGVLRDLDTGEGSISLIPPVLIFGLIALTLLAIPGVIGLFRALTDL